MFVGHLVVGTVVYMTPLLALGTLIFLLGSLYEGFALSYHIFFSPVCLSSLEGLLFLKRKGGGEE